MTLSRQTSCEVSVAEKCAVQRSRTHDLAVGPAGDGLSVPISHGVRCVLEEVGDADVVCCAQRLLVNEEERGRRCRTKNIKIWDLASDQSLISP